jgi:DNA-binding response OmpR family regulator
MPDARIVIFEQQADAAEALAAHLQKAGYEVQIVSDGEDDLPQVRAMQPDLVILNGAQSERSGARIVKRLRTSTRTAHAPILLIATHDETSDNILGQNAGADDFIVQPVNPAELTARTALLLQRSEHRRDHDANLIQIGPISINMDRHEVSVNDKLLKLTLTEFRLLSTLAEADGRILRRNLLIDQAIGMDAIVTDRTIDVHLTALRRKLGPARRCLKTVRGVGYRLADD